MYESSLKVIIELASKADYKLFSIATDLKKPLLFIDWVRWGTQSSQRMLGKYHELFSTLWYMNLHNCDVTKHSSIVC